MRHKRRILALKCKQTGCLEFLLCPTTKKTQTTSLDDIEIVIPHALQMGWSESPPFFCAATETARDIIETYYNTFPNIPHHPLESFLYNHQFTQSVSGVATLAKEVLSELKQSHKHSQPYQRPSNWLGNAPRSSKQKKLTKHQWHGNWKATEETTPRPHHN